MHFLEDARHAMRFLLKSLRTEFASTAVIVLTLALAISANTVCFGFINALLFKTQPGIGDPATLVDVGSTLRGAGFDQLSFPNFLDYQKESKVFAALAAYAETPRSMSLRTSAQAERVWGVPVTGNLFDVLEAKPSAGRFFVPDDELPGHELVAVISHSFWQRRFAGDPSVVGRKVFLNARPVTIVGIGPKGFEGINYVRTDIWTPLVTEIFHRQEVHMDRSSTFSYGIARLKPGVSIEQGQAELNVISAQLQKAYPDDNRNRGARLVPHNPFSVLESSFYGFVAMLFVIALLLLLIACSNVAGVCVARNAARSREIAIRMAIGAPRRRVIAQLMTETAALFVIAGLIAGLGASWLNALVARLQFLLPVPIAIDLTPDARVFGFVLFLVVFAGAAAGLLPALHATRTAPASAVKEEITAGALRPSRLRSAFVVTQIAVSLLLLVVGGLFLRSLSLAGSVDLGLDPKNLEAISLNWFISGYGEPPAQSPEPFERMLLARVSSLPNVDSASLAIDIPMDGGSNGFNVVTIPGLVSADSRNGIRNADWNLVSPGYFKTMKIPLIRGRDFTDAEQTGVAIVNETMARRYWPGEDPVGKQFYDGTPGDGRLMHVIGVAKDTNTRYVGPPADPMLYAPLGQYSYPQHYLIVRTVDGASVAPALRGILSELNSNFPIISVQSMRELIGVGLLPQRIGAWVGSIMGLVGVLLASLGVYGVTAFFVTRRTREIGIRTALGARPMDILRFVLREGARLGLTGLGIGWAGALALTRFIGSFLFGVAPTDGLSFISMTALLGAVTLVATYIPARRAARLDPIVALRHE